jgi:hypothetical protein
MAKGTAVAEATKGNALVLMSSFEEDAQSGFDGMNQEDFALPFLKLLTNTSPEIGDVEGAVPGMIYNSVTGSLFDGKKGILVIPCAYVRQYIEWAPRGSGAGAPIAIYPSTSDILSKTHREPGENRDYLDNGNYIENTANHYVMLLDDNGVPSPALIVLKSTQLKKSRKWNSMMMSIKMPGKNGLFTPPMYSQIYRLTTVKESNDKGQWFGWEVGHVGAIEDANVFQGAKAFATSVSSGDVKVKHSDEEATSPSAVF